MKNTAHFHENILDEIFTQSCEQRSEYLNAIKDEEFFLIAPIIIEAIVSKGIKKAEYFNIPNVLISRYLAKKGELNFQAIYNCRSNICGAILNALKEEKALEIEDDNLLYTNALKEKVNLLKPKLQEMKLPRNLDIEILNLLMEGVAYEEILVRLQSFLDSYNGILECVGEVGQVDAIMLCLTGILKGYYIVDKNGNKWVKDKRHNSDIGAETKLFNFNLLVSYLHHHGLSVQHCIELYNVFEFIIDDENSHMNLLERSNQDTTVLKKVPQALSVIMCEFVYQIIDRDKAISMLRDTRENISDKSQCNNHWYIVAKSFKNAKVASESSEIMVREATSNFIAILDELYNMRSGRRNRIDEMNLSRILEVMGNPEFISNISFYSTDLRLYLNRTYLLQSAEMKAIVCAIIWKKFFIHCQKGEHNGVKMMLEYIMIHRNSMPTNMNTKVHYHGLDEEIICVIDEVKGFGVFGCEDDNKIWSEFYHYSHAIFGNFARHLIVYDIEEQLHHIDGDQCNILRNFLKEIVLCSNEERKFLSASSIRALDDIPCMSIGEVFNTIRDPHVGKIFCNLRNAHSLVNIKINNRLSIPELHKIPIGHDMYFLYVYGKNPLIMECLSIGEAIQFYEKDRDLAYIALFIERYKRYDNASKDVLKSVLKKYHKIETYQLLCQNQLPHDLIQKHGISIGGVAELVASNYYYMKFVMRGYEHYVELRDDILERLHSQGDAGVEELGVVFKYVRFHKNKQFASFNVALMESINKQLKARKLKHPQTKSVKYLETLGVFLEHVKHKLDSEVTAGYIVHVFTKVHNKGIKFKSEVLMMLRYMSRSKYTNLYSPKAVLQLIESNIIKEILIAIRFFFEMDIDVNIIEIVNDVLLEDNARNAFVIISQEEHGVEYINSLLNQSRPIHEQLIDIFSDAQVLEKYEVYKRCADNMGNVSPLEINTQIEEDRLISCVFSVCVGSDVLVETIKDSHFSNEDSARLCVFLNCIIKMDLNHTEILSNICHIYSTAHRNSFLFVTSDHMISLLQEGNKWNEVVCFAYNVNIVKGGFER